MARLALVILCAFLAVPPAHTLQESTGATQRSAGESFEQGVRAWRAGDVESARLLWLEALEAAERSAEPVARAAILYDLGNAAFRRGEPLEATAWYTAAVRLAPRDADAWANLEFARAKAELPPADRGDLVSTLRRLVSILDLSESEWFVFVTGTLLCALAGAWAWFGGTFLRRATLCALALVALALAPWIHNLRRATRPEVMVIAEEGTPALNEPRAGSTLLERLAPAEVRQKLDALPGWVRVELEDDTAGWVASDAVFELDR